VKKTARAPRAPRATAHRPRVVTRYGNRKLYDPSARKYVTLDHLATMVAAGEDVRVVERATREDITSVVFAQVILELVRARAASIPDRVLAGIIRLASGPAAAWAEWGGTHEAAARARQEAERIASGLLSRGRLTLDEALGLRQEIAGSVQRLLSGTQKGLESRLRGLVGGKSPRRRRAARKS
jgi:polyhydroxyalkanoate synthesis repressor PhaR